MRTGLLALLCLAAAGTGEEPDPEVLAEARTRVRDLEADIQALIDKVAPAVGAVVNHRTLFDPETGRVRMAPGSLGSGLVVTRDGFFLTNVHVVEGAGYVTVALPGGRSYPADRYADTSEGMVKGDIALLKLRGARRFPFVDWKRGRSRDLDVGDFVFAMGNPHGHALDGVPVVTMGIISGKGVPASDRGFMYVDALQTDAEINPGNSGGPLFDSDGEFVGINGLMYSLGNRSNSGVGFAIPIDQVRVFMKRLLRSEGGGVGYGFHGLDVDTAPEGGARVLRVWRASPAAEAGIDRGDVITRVNGRRVQNRSEFVNAVGKLPEKKVVRVTFSRGRRTKAVSFKLASFQDYLAEHGRPRADRPLPLHERGYAGFFWKRDEKNRVVIDEVPPDGPAAKARLRPGDVVIAVDKAPAATKKQFVTKLSFLAPETKISLEIERDGRPRKVRLELCDAAAAAGLEE